MHGSISSVDREAVSTATWQGGTLVIETTVKAEGEVQAVSQRTWSMDSNKQLVIDTLNKPTSRSAAPSRPRTQVRTTKLAEQAPGRLAHGCRREVELDKFRAPAALAGFDLSI
jgi:hypothetical protein